jgi:XTP/dITP diphosphohydrolase
MELIFATNNQHKTNEIKAVVPPSIKIITLNEAGIDIDIPEPYFTLEENAAEKGRTIFFLTGKNCFAEDTGLEVKALSNEPGVHSAHYAGEDKSPAKNVEKLLYNLKPYHDRTGRFRTIIFLILNNQEYYFEGVCTGTIISQPLGNQGFGYDPVFVPVGANKTFAQMTIEEKNKFSHRKKAMVKMVTFLNHLNIKG